MLKEVMTATEAAIAKATEGLGGDDTMKPGDSPRRAANEAGGVTPAAGGSVSAADGASPSLRGGKLGGTEIDIHQRGNLDGIDDYAYMGSN